MFSRLSNQKGMSLLEIMIAMGIMAAVVGGIMKIVSDRQRSANIETARTAIAQLEGSVKYYKTKKSKYPTADEGLNALVEAKITDEVPKDPWGNDYVYSFPGTHGKKKFEICSGGEEDDDETDDICNWSEDAE